MNELIFAQVPLWQYLIFTSILFGLGIAGVISNKRSLINILFSIEIMLLSVNLNFIAFSKSLGDITGQIFTIFILAVAAAEAAVGLAIVMIFFRKNHSIDIEQPTKLKG